MNDFKYTSEVTESLDKVMHIISATVTVKPI